MSTAARTLTVRLPRDLYEASAALARQRGRSLNALVQEGLAALLKDAEYARLYQAFGELGQDPESDVEYAFPAQAEVVVRDER